MRYFTKGKIGIALFVFSLIIIIFMFLGATNTISNVSAVETEGVGVYWDSGCTDRVSQIDWEVLTPGSKKNIVVNIRNEVEDQMSLLMSTKNWNPSEASRYLTLRWDYNGRRMDQGETLQVTLILFVSSNIEGISSFGFDVTIIGDSLPGDANGDDIVDIFDLTKVQIGYDSKLGESNWIPEVDFNKDDIIDIFDISIVTQNFGERLTQ